MRYPVSRASGLVILFALLPGCGGNGGTSDGGGAVAASDLPPGVVYLADDASCPPPRCFEVQIPVTDDVKVTDNHVRVILPDGYGQNSRRYPVLYLLHDAPGDYKSWTQLGHAFEFLQGLDVIAIMPDGGGGNPGWYSDWEDGSYQWETYHIDVMMPFLESHLRVLGDGHRAVAGPSMGGYGSMAYSARHPGLFAAAAGFSGAVDFLALEQASALVGFLANPVAGTPNGPIWGDPVTNYAVWQDHDPGTHVDGLAGMKIFLACGNGLPGGPHEQLDTPQLYVIEPFLLIMNTSFDMTLTNAGVEHETFFYGPGFHDWPYYRDSFAWALPKLMEVIQPQ
jgi:diacylglycerol O-acyltransferase / trehalose O-mycolyltransferase